MVFLICGAIARSPSLARSSAHVSVGASTSFDLPHPPFTASYDWSMKARISARCASVSERASVRARSGPPRVP